MILDLLSPFALRINANGFFLFVLIFQIIGYLVVLALGLCSMEFRNDRVHKKIVRSLEDIARVPVEQRNERFEAMFREYRVAGFKDNTLQSEVVERKERFLYNV